LPLLADSTEKYVASVEQMGGVGKGEGGIGERDAGRGR